MKKTICLLHFILVSAIGFTQKMASGAAATQLIELSMSTPQPRLKETFEISIDVDHLKANIFKSLAGKVQPAEGTYSNRSSELTFTVKALQKGNNEIGPLEFLFNNTKYTTNKVSFEVIDSLPNTNKGVWFRKVMTGKTTFCIIIEQRIPAKTKTTKVDNAINLSTEAEYTNLVKFKDSYSIKGAHGNNSNSNTNFNSTIINGEEREYMYGYSIYHFTIDDKRAKITISKDLLENIPDDYKFEDIIIQEAQLSEQL